MFAYPSFQPVEQSTILNVTGASADVAETTVQLPSALPSNTSGILYFVSVASIATGVNSTLFLRHKPGGLNAGGVESSVLNRHAYAQIITGPNSGSVTYIATKGSATAFDYVISLVGFFRSY